MSENQLAWLLGQLPIETFRPVQTEAITLSLDSPAGNIFEIPTGEGKSAIGIAICLNAASQGKTAFYVVPTKGLIDQICRQFPDQTQAVYGRSEYECLFYSDSLKIQPPVNAADSPCYMLDCRHRVNQETGIPLDPEAAPCPYYHAKFVALRAAQRNRVIVCTNAFFLLNRILVKQWDMENTCVVFDEGHGLANEARRIFEYDISDYHLSRTAKAIRAVAPKQAYNLRRFTVLLKRAIRIHENRKTNLFEQSETERLLPILEEFDAGEVERATVAALQSGALDAFEDRESIKALENAVRNIPRFLRNLRFALPREERKPLSYVVAHWYKTDDPEMVSGRRKARYHLALKSYYVAPLIRKAAGGDVTVISATIGNPSIFGFETGLTMPFASYGSSFSSNNMRVYLPTDTPNLSTRKARRDDPRKCRKMLVDAAVRFAEAGKRSLVVVVSDEERLSIADRGRKAGLNVMTYSPEENARETVRRFKDGEGQILVGTFAQYGQGVDLPGGMAPVILVLRPGYQHPDDPMTQFEEQRFSKSRCWQLWQYRVMQKALQVRGRNIRTAEDIGVTIFFSQQFKEFLYGSLPEWLRPSYDGKKKLENVVTDALELLG